MLCPQRGKLTKSGLPSDTKNNFYTAYHCYNAKSKLWQIGASLMTFSIHKRITWNNWQITENKRWNKRIRVILNHFLQLYSFAKPAVYLAFL